MPVTEEHFVFDGHDLESYVDENTIGVVAIMGVTFNGLYEPAKRSRRSWTRSRDAPVSTSRSTSMRRRAA